MREQNQIGLLFFITLAIGLFAGTSLLLFPPGNSGGSPHPGEMLGYLAGVLLLLLPFLLLSVYMFYGREEECLVPEYLSMVPDPSIRPWVVNLLFTGDPLDFDENGFYATLLDLHRKGSIRVSLDVPGKARIQILRDQTCDEYETRVLAFLRDLSRDDLLSLDTLQANFEDQDFEPDFRRQRAKQTRTYRLLVSVPEMVPTSRYFENGFRFLLPVGVLGILLYAASFLCAGMVAGDIGKAAVSAVAPSVLLAGSLYTLWNVQEYAQRHRTNWEGLVCWLVLLAALILFPYYRDLLASRWELPALGALAGVAGACILAAAWYMGGLVSRLTSAMIPFVLALWIGILTFPGLRESSQATIALVLPSLLPLVLVIQVMAAMSFPSTLLGRWRGNLYGERCRWDAFRAFLTDFAMIRRDSPRDLSVWGDWLVYGTALGVGDTVIRAMKDLKIEIPEAEIAPALREGFTSLARYPLPAGGG
jgi:hypothetical protein